jgi:hypothetical protein
VKESIIELSEHFWNIRGSFRAAGILQVGTQASLIKLQDGRFVFLDSYTLPEHILQKVYDITDGGKDVDAIINTHPFHTVHVKRAHKQFPTARLFGTRRHVARAGSLPWQDILTEDPRIAEEFPELQFSVPRGVDFISDNSSVHFSSVLVYHPLSKTLHVDDTFNFIKLPMFQKLDLHPTLASALKKEPQATQDFRQWTLDMAEQWADAQNVCTAHVAPLIGIDDFQDRVQKALNGKERVLQKHARRTA